MAGKVGCALLLAVLFAAAAVSRTSFAVFLVSLAVLLVGFWRGMSAHCAGM